MKHKEPVHKIMATDPLTVHEKQSVSEIHHLMVERRIHHVPVVSGKRLIGLISATDLMRVSFGDVNKQDPRTVDALLDTYTIRDVMQEDILTVKPSDTVRTAAEHLARGDFHSLPVVGDDDELVGLVTSTDLIKYLLDQY
ncbi:MAG: CBS domain-containing protein [Myxococcales bacterium]|nr:CBS domain-containing protein [Myxococcales bacterium]MCB9715863.1 CBS domain-containing protein [Myxococcales bacterium]